MLSEISEPVAWVYVLGERPAAATGDAEAVTCVLSILILR